MINNRINNSKKRTQIKLRFMHKNSQCLFGSLLIHSAMSSAYIAALYDTFAIGEVHLGCLQGDVVPLGIDGFPRNRKKVSDLNLNLEQKKFNRY